MLTYTDAEIKHMIGDLESDLVERKEAWAGDAPTKGRQAVCGFANDLPDHRKPGVLIIGVKDNGQFTGTPITDELLQTLTHIKTDSNILPPPTIVVEKRRIESNEVAVVTVQPSFMPPVRYKGRIWIRTGPRRDIATAQDERILNEKRKYRDIPFDIQPVPSSMLSDLDRLAFEEEYLSQAFSKDILMANDRTYEERLSALKMIGSTDEPVPTILGLLVLGKRTRDWINGDYIQFLRIDGSELGDPIVDELTIDGFLSQILRRLDEKLDSHNRIAVDITSRQTEKRYMPYPRVALQQITRNAVMHRSYEGTNAPVRIYWFNDRIEVHNPGGPFGSVTAENFGMPGITDYRNPNIADAMKTLGYVQKFGFGISLAQKELIDNGNPPLEFRVESSYILVTIRSK